MHWKPLTAVFLLLLGLSSAELASEPKRFVVKRPPGTLYKPMLTLDGGGLRVYMTNQILIELENQIATYFLKHPEFLPPEAKGITSRSQLEVQLADFFDCIGGVSAGSWAGLYYASKGKGAAEVLRKPDIIRKYGNLYPGSATGLDIFFLEYGDIIFPTNPFYYAVGLGIRLSLFDIPGLSSPFLTASIGIERALKEFLGERVKMTDLETSCIVNAYSVKHGASVLFTYLKNETDVRSSRSSATVVVAKTIERKGRNETAEKQCIEDLEAFTDYRPDLVTHQGEDFYIRDVARASSAIPSFWEAKKVESLTTNSIYECIDGGLVVSNPTMHSANVIMQMQPEKEGRNLQKFAVLSVGTGVVHGENLRGFRAGPLRRDFVENLVNIVINGGSDAIQANFDFFLHRGLFLPTGQYMRIQIVAEQDTEAAKAIGAFSDVKYLDTYKRLGKETALKYRKGIENLVSKYLMATEQFHHSAAT